MYLTLSLSSFRVFWVALLLQRLFLPYERYTYIFASQLDLHCLAASLSFVSFASCVILSYTCFMFILRVPNVIPLFIYTRCQCQLVN